ncbi:MAG: U32 family peptidase [Lachnospiraceae bacterium]|nr:U32 family peptidase [bacterium]MDY5518309.1 U32 family peptidase [Lachnospiraceae bacterium]
MKKMELLAPAGSLETLKAVCAAGADAVYLGGELFGARAYAKNFTQEELLYAIDYVHLHGKKLHLTVNTLLKNRELEEQLYDYLLPYYEQGLDAVIVQDAGVFAFVKKHFPGLELHASTQMTISGMDGAAFWKKAGADRVVLARELSIEEIRQIHQKLDVELECFVHGALCYCYSGQCLFSSMLGGRSGNRGRCAQPCRLPYSVTNKSTILTKGELYPLSPRDLCAIDLLPELMQAGVSSLKIEGRMKQTQYAAGVTRIYRKYLDICEAMAGESESDSGRNEKKEDYAVAEKDRNALLELGNRSGFTNGYLRGEKGREMMSLRSPKHTAIQPENEATGASEHMKRSIIGVCSCVTGNPVSLTVTDVRSGLMLTVYGGEVQPAKNAPVQASDVEKVLRQTGDTDFEFTALQIDLDKNCFLPKQFLKAVRREALENLKERILFAYRRYGHALAKEDICMPASLQYTAPIEKKRIFAVCDTPQQLSVCAAKDYIETIALQMQSFEPENLCKAIKQAAFLCADADKKMLLAMPAAFRAQTAACYEEQWSCIQKLQEEGKIEGFLAKNYDSLGFLDRMGVSADHVWLDSQLYTFSSRAACFFREQGYQNRTLPLELNARELRRIPKDGSILVIYGHTPFMVSNQCINKNISGCDRAEKTLELIDRYGKHLPVKNYCSICTNIIYNAMPTMLFSDRTWTDVEAIHPRMLRMDFSVENEAETAAVLALYEKQVLGRKTDEPLFSGEFTKGHFARGVE